MNKFEPHFFPHELRKFFILNYFTYKNRWTVLINRINSVMYKIH